MRGQYNNGGSSVKSENTPGVPAVPPQLVASQEQTHLWHQQCFAGLDSGIQSGISTNAASVYSGGGYDAMEPEAPLPPTPAAVYEMHQQFTHQEYTSDQMDDISQQYYSTRGQRVRAAMFPETLEEGTEYPTTQLMEQPTAVGHLAEPAQLLKQGVHDLVQFQSNADTCIKIIPDLVKLLQDDDKEVVARTARFVEELSKHDASRSALMADARLVSALIQAMQSTSDEDAANLTTKTLYRLSTHPGGWEVIFHSYGIPFLIKLLGYPMSSIVRFALLTLHNLIENQPQAKVEIFRNRGIQAMVPLLASQDLKFVTIVCDCLKHLTIGNQEAKMIISAVNGPVALLRLIQSNVQGSRPYEKMLNAAISVLKAVSVEELNKRMIIRAEGVEILFLLASASSTKFQSSRVQTGCLYVLRNLSDMIVSDPEFKDKNMDHALEYLVPLLARESSKPNSVDPLLLCAAGILSNLTCNNVDNKMKVCRLNGIQLLLQACQRYPNKEEVTEPAMCTLRHITGRHPECEQMRILVEEIGGLVVIANMLRQPSHWTLIKAIVGFIQNLAVVPSSRGPLRELKVLERVVQLLFQSYQMITEACAKGTPVTKLKVDNVWMHDVMESTIGALSQLAKDNPKNRAIIRNNDVVPVLVQLMNFPVENVLRFVASLLAELTHDREGAELVEQCGALPGLSQLLHRPRTSMGPDAIGQYAAEALYRIGETKSPEFRQQLQAELLQVVGQPSVNGQWGSNEIAADFDYMLPGDYPHPYQSSGPPSVHGSVIGSVHGTNLSVYDPDNMSGVDMGPYNPNHQVWEQYSAPPSAQYNMQAPSQQSMEYQSMSADTLSWKDSDV